MNKVQIPIFKCLTSMEYLLNSPTCQQALAFRMVRLPDGVSRGHLWGCRPGARGPKRPGLIKLLQIV